MKRKRITIPVFFLVLSLRLLAYVAIKNLAKKAGVIGTPIKKTCWKIFPGRYS